MLPSKEVPNGWQEEGCACGDEAEEEDDYGKVLLVHEVVAQTGATICDATIGELDIESSERGGKAFNEEGM